MSPIHAHNYSWGNTRSPDKADSPPNQGPERHLKPEKKPADPKEQANHSEKEQGGVSEVSQLML
jgi:hypothetical protein